MGGLPSRLCPSEKPNPGSPGQEETAGLHPAVLLSLGMAKCGRVAHPFRNFDLRRAAKILFEIVSMLTGFVKSLDGTRR